MSKNWQIAPEDVGEKTMYEITLAPNDDNQYFGRKYRLHRLDTFINNNHEKLFKLFNGKLQYCNLKTEISKHGRLHFHGIICFGNIKNIVNYYMNVVHELEDNYSVAINNLREDYWETYTDKQAQFGFPSIDLLITPKTLINNPEGLLEKEDLLYKTAVIKRCLLDQADSDN